MTMSQERVDELDRVALRMGDYVVKRIHSANPKALRALVALVFELGQLAELTPEERKESRDTFIYIGEHDAAKAPDTVAFLKIMDLM